jgi:RNA polymerase sigma factor (sigma-70 family)
MSTPIDPLLTVGPFDDDGSDQEEILRKYEPYIRSLVRKQYPHGLVHPDLLDVALDDVVQDTWVKLWLALRQSRITNIKGYIRCIVHSEIVNMIRRYKATLPLPVDEDDELDQNKMIVAQGEGLRDPACEIEEREAATEYMAETVEQVLTLPPRQKQVMICALRERIDDLLALIRAFEARTVDIGEVRSPEGMGEVLKARASLSIARRKLRSSLSFGKGQQ